MLLLREAANKQQNWLRNYNYSVAVKFGRSRDSSSSSKLAVRTGMVVR